MKTDPLKTIEGIGKIGYAEVEGFGYNEEKLFGIEPMEFVRVLANSGLSMPSIHYIVSLTSWDKTKNQLTDVVKKAMSTFAEMGVKMVVCPFMVNAQRDEESVKKLCNVFNHTAELCRQYGMSFGYHNHDFEFQSNGGPLIYDLLLQRTDPKLVQFELDIYWVVYAGQDPIEWMKKASGRVTALHVKDMSVSRETIEVGEGSINFAEIFALEEAAKVKYYIVELEHYKRTPMEGIEVSYKNLKKLLDV